MKASSQSEKFAKLMIRELWDRPIEHHDLLARGQWKTPGLRALQSALSALTEDQKVLVAQCVRQALSTGLHGVLFALQEAHDNGQGIEVLVDGANVAALSDGLQGEPYGEEGWISRYSKYRALE